MPANLTPQYKEAEQHYRAAASHEDKLAALREMLALLPKHKGTEKLQADLRHPDHERPFVLPQGARVLDLASAVHKEIAERLKFARVWGHARFEGQQVDREHVLFDRDVVELHG